MCRLAAFPPGFPKKLAIEHMKRLLSFNKDGVGTAHVKKGKFQVVKYAGNLDTALKDGIPLFEHMPYGGWTVAHVRAATHGGNTINNTHPFIKGDYCVVHNGIWSASDQAKVMLEGFVKFQGDTDSEVAAFLLRKMGPRKFFDFMSAYSGVFLALQRNGALWAMNCGGQLEIQRQKHGVVIASTLPSSKVYQLYDGYAIFKKDGSPVLLKKRKSANWDNSYGYGGRYKKSGGCSQDIFDDDYEYYATKGITNPKDSN